jgi:hypothetical protein
MIGLETKIAGYVAGQNRKGGGDKNRYMGTMLARGDNGTLNIQKDCGPKGLPKGPKAQSVRDA